MKNIFLRLLFMTMGYGCSSKAPKECVFVVVNNSPNYLDSVTVTTKGSKCVVKGVPPNQKVEKTINIQHEGTYEGAFLASIFIKDSAKNRVTFGYYDHPKNVRPRYTIEIKNDYTIKELQ